jgi:hypothetical protein
MLNVAVIGLGWWGRTIVRTLQGSDSLRVARVVDVNPAAAETARQLGVDVSDVSQNVHGGAAYLRAMLDEFGGDLRLGLAAYNAGPTAIERAGGAPTIETLRYVKNVELSAGELAGCR